LKRGYRLTEERNNKRSNIEKGIIQVGGGNGWGPWRKKGKKRDLVTAEDDPRTWGAARIDLIHRRGRGSWDVKKEIGGGGGKDAERGEPGAKIEKIREEKKAHLNRRGKLPFVT